MEEGSAVARHAPRGLRSALDWLYRVESTVTILGFAGITAALFFDLASREFLGRGLFGAQRFAVYCMVVVAFLGFALAVGWRAHLGIEVADKLTPAAWDATMNRVSDAVAAAGCVFLAYWSWKFVAGSYQDQARGQAIEILLWPVQTILIWSFGSSALRYLAYAAWPAVKPRNGDLPEA